MTGQDKARRRRLKYVATINDDALSEDTDSDYEMQYVDIGNVDSAGRVNQTTKYTFANAPSRARRRVRHGDVIVSCVRTYLQAIAPVRDPPGNLVVSTGFAVVRPRPGILDTAYSSYALREPSFLAEVGMRSAGVSYPAITSSELREIPICVPSLSKQKAITTFVDRETALIDAMIAAKQRLLRLTVEKQRALIYRAVCCGLNPNVPYRDGGIPWLRRIPTHWDVWRIGHLAKVGNGSTPRRNNERYWFGGTIPWLNSGVVGQEEIISSEQCVTDAAMRECHLPALTPGTVLVAITGQGKTRGRAAVLSIEATISQHLAFIASDPVRLNAWFLRWWLFAAYPFLRSVSDDAGGTKGALTCEALADLRIPLPPLVEQQEIVRYIAGANSCLEGIRSAAIRTVDLLKERRQALITAAVTGQVDVGQAA